MHKLLVALLAMLALAGCATEGETSAEPEPEPEPVSLPDAEAALAAGERAANLVHLGGIDLGGEEADGCGDYLAVDQGSVIRIVQMGFDVDGSVLLSEISSIAGNGPKDVKWSDDCNYLVTGNDAQLAQTPLDPVVTMVQSGGMDVYNVEDKGMPQHVGYFPVGPVRGPHMVFYLQQDDGTELIFGANADVSIQRFDRDAGTLTELARYTPNPVTEVNRDPQVIDAYYQLYTHDMFAMEDPVTDQTLLYTASWDAGVHIVDVTDPSNPVQLGLWNDFGESETGNLHTVATEWIGDRRITVGSVEVGFEIVGGTPYFTGTERSVLYVWDTTDPANIQLLSVWENPMGIGPGQAGLAAPVVTQDEVMSTHNLQLEQGRIYMAHYGLGVWVLDVSTPEKQAAPQIVAVDLDAGNLWDTIVHQGVVFTSGSTGTQAYHFPLDVLGPEGIHSRA
ncbi:MAG: LVIVD repeat-containing protein [Thermoplasmatota archaeon]